METKRKGYKTLEQQYEATKRYYANNPEAKERKKISSLRSNVRRYLKEFSSLEDLEEFENLIKERRKVLNEN